ncbi:hypothetical protein ZIOFF_008595 [Zingiber officinale]|uniref:CCHC-type domain-containing protein n=1 Tax=Zingiber officinale TaxID=94328 RepID=A0A8J5HZ26_ZINOF|nr:hypothetical protein ZIOFF_008595 [Zingiber officinale]
MEAIGSKSVFDAFKLDSFDGTNFIRWKDKLFFLLTELGVAYLLLHDLSVIPAPTDKDTDEIKATWKKQEEDEVRCRGYILNALSDRLYDLFRSIKYPQEIWNALENKYTSEKQVDELLVLVSRLKYLKIEVCDPAVNNIESKKAGYSEKKRKFVETSSQNFTNKKKTKTCYFCGKKDHYKNECRFYKKLKVEGNVGQKTVNVFKRPPSPLDIVAMIVDLKISMIIECNMATSEKSADWWYDSGASVHVCNEKSLFKNYKLAAKEERVLMGNHDMAIVLGKGTIEIQFTSGKKMILMNILHVPDDKDIHVMKCSN